MKKISVIVPVYNVEKYLKRCINSILNQSYKELEILLIDDGSTDLSSVFCDQYADEDNRIKVIHKENEGVSSARNCGLEMATGQYITFVDSDDYIELNMYEKMMEIAEKYDCDVIMCDCIKEFGNKKEIYTHNIDSGYYDRSKIEKEYLFNLLIMPNVEYPPTISNCLCLFKNKRYIKDDCKGFKVINERKSNFDLRYEVGIRFSEDLLFGAELMYWADSFYYMKKQCFYHYCMNSNSASHTFKIDKWNDYMKLHEVIQNKFSGCKIFNFDYQINLVLLFFLYNSISDIVTTKKLSLEEKKSVCNHILSEKKVKDMFDKINIIKLKISFKQKILTFMYKYNMGITFLIKREYRRR